MLRKAWGGGRNQARVTSSRTLPNPGNSFKIPRMAVASGGMKVAVTSSLRTDALEVLREIFEAAHAYLSFVIEYRVD